MFPHGCHLPVDYAVVADLTFREDHFLNKNQSVSQKSSSEPVQAKKKPRTRKHDKKERVLAQEQQLSDYFGPKHDPARIFAIKTPLDSPVQPVPRALQQPINVHDTPRSCQSRIHEDNAESLDREIGQAGFPPTSDHDHRHSKLHLESRYPPRDDYQSFDTRAPRIHLEEHVSSVQGEKILYHAYRSDHGSVTVPVGVAATPPAQRNYAQPSAEPVPEQHPHQNDSMDDGGRNSPRKLLEFSKFYPYKSDTDSDLYNPRLRDHSAHGTAPLCRTGFLAHGNFPGREVYHLPSPLAAFRGYQDRQGLQMASHLSQAVVSAAEDSIHPSINLAPCWNEPYLQTNNLKTYHGQGVPNRLEHRYDEDVGTASLPDGLLEVGNPSLIGDEELEVIAEVEELYGHTDLNNDFDPPGTTHGGNTACSAVEDDRFARFWRPNKLY